MKVKIELPTEYHLHVHSDKSDNLVLQALVQLKNLISNQGSSLMATIAEVLQASKDALAQTQATKDAVDQIPPAIDALEAKVTELIGKQGTLTAEQQAALDEAFANLSTAVTTAQGTATTASTAAADAADGIDEAAPPTP